MLRYKSNSLQVNEIAEYLNAEFMGENVNVTSPSPLSKLKEGAISFIETKEDLMAAKGRKCVLLTKGALADKSAPGITWVVSENPRRDFYKVLREFFTEDLPHVVEASASIGSTVKLGRNVHVGKNTIIDGEVTIGYNTYIGNNVVIKGSVEIGSGCILKDSVVVGGEGFDFVRDEVETFHIPKLGHITIKDNVWIGVSATIERPTFNVTLIEKDAKIDDLVHIGESSTIGASTQVAAGAIVSKDVNVGRNCFIGINASIKPGLKIASGVTLGMGAVLTKDIAIESSVYAGVPARNMRR